MATLTLKKASWCLQISRSSRLFSVSFTTALPRKGSSRRLPSPPANPLRVPDSFRPSRHQRAREDITAHHEARRHFTSTRVYRAQQAAVASPSSKATSLDPQPNQSPEAIKPNADDFSAGLNDKSLDLKEADGEVDWAKSFSGLSTEAFSPEAAKVLLAPIEADDIEIKSDGIIYLPEIKYRRILNQAFGPGGWGLAPRGETIVTAKSVTREYALVALGRLVSVARGEQDYFSPEGIPTAVEGCKSTALRRCCKDLGIASELWDPRFIRKFMANNVKEVFVEHQVTKKRRKIYLRKDDKVSYPYKETKYGA